METYYQRHELADDPFSWIEIHPLFPKGADFPFDHAGVGETSLMLALAPDLVAMNHAADGGHWFTKTASAATPELGEAGVKIALDHLRRSFGLRKDRTR